MVVHPIESEGRCRKSKRLAIPPRRLFMAPLIAAAVLGGSQPAANADFDPPGPDTFCASDATGGVCCLSSSCVATTAIVLPELGGSFGFIPDGVFLIGSEEVRLTGEITSKSQPTIRLSVEIDMSGRQAPPPSPIKLLAGFCPVDTDLWTAYTTWSGELVGLPGSFLDGATYAITGTSDVQFGEGANNRNLKLGLFGRFDYELVDPVAHPGVPVGPFPGEVSIDLLPGADTFSGIHPSCFPPAEPDLAGTWTGTIDCVGFDAEAGPSAKPVEEFFSAAVLKIGRSTNKLDVGDQYSVRLTREAGNARSFCAYAPNNPGSTTGGQGVLVEPSRQQARVHFKFEGDTLRARELVANGLHGTQLCKWSFTRTNPTAPAVADACSSTDGCLIFHTPGDQCNDNATCGQHPNSPFSPNCTCKDGFVGTGQDFQGAGGCFPAP